MVRGIVEQLSLLSSRAILKLIFVFLLLHVNLKCEKRPQREFGGRIDRNIGL